MKKVVLAVMIMLSALVFGDYLEDKLEMKLMRNYPRLTDGINKMSIKEYDVDVKKDRVEVEIKAPKEQAREEFAKLDRDGLEKELEKMVADIRKELNDNIPVKVEIEIEKESSSSKKLYSNYL
ncbi:MAG: hypothetical protein ACRC7F_02270 [Cetobacterium sp.]